MKHLSFFIAAIVFSLPLFSQPVIPKDSGIYVAGNSFVMKEVALTADQDVGSAGSLVLWDFSGLTPTSTRSTDVDSAESSSIVHDIVANMKVSIVRGPGGAQTQEYYYFQTSSGMEYSGKIDNGIPLDVGDNPVFMWSWPLEYQDSSTDTIDSKFEYGPTPFSKKWHYLNGNMTTTVDGYGRVKLPYGDVFEVLRIKTVETYNDSTTTEVTPVTNTTFEWRNPYNKIFVARYEKREEGTTTDRFFYYIDEADLNGGEQPASIEQLRGVKDELLIYPNPVEAEVAISFILEESGKVNLGIYDFQGRLVKELMEDGLDQGLQLFSFDIADVAAGSYVLRLDRDGIVQEKKLLRK